MQLTLPDPQTTIAEITSFLQDAYQRQGKTNAVIAISGGIDSAVSLSVLKLALANNDIYPVLLPYGEQSTEDSRRIIEWNQIPLENVTEINIQPMVDLIAQNLNLSLNEEDKARRGNIMARVRMIVIYDLAKSKDALVCGTENKSEKYLGYFTRFGDEASDIEPIQHLYKTQVRQVAEHLGLPDVFLTKAPTAGLWDGQTDESEMGFSYADADRVLVEYIDQQKQLSEIQIEGVDPLVIKKVVDQIEAQKFKHQVPYTLQK